MSSSQKQIDDISNFNEKMIAILFKDMGFEYITANLEIKDKEGKNIGEIDLIFKFQNYYFLFEVTNQQEKVHESAGNWYSKWTSEENILALFKTINRPKQKTIRIFIDLSHNSEISNTTSISHHLKKDDNKYLFGDDIQYFKTYTTHVGTYTKNDFLSLIDLPRSDEYKKIPAIKFFVDGVPAYSFIAPVKTLLETCYISRRKDKKLGYQRALTFSRIKEITKNINDRKIIAFPNAIILNSIKKIDNDNKKEEECPVKVTLLMPKNYCEFKVIDGQHRLLGFANANDIIKETSYLPVICFENMENKKEIKMFIDINSKQKRVDSNLVLLLKKEFDWNINENEYYDKICVNICEKININGPLKNRIYFGTANETSKNKVRLVTMVSLLKTNGFIRKRNALWLKKPDDMETPLSNMNNILKLTNTMLVKKKNDIFLQNIGLRTLFKFISIIQYNINSKRINVTFEEVFTDLQKIISDPVISEINKSYGEGGAKNAALLLCNKLKNQDKIKYNSLETDMRIAKTRSK